MAKLRRTLLIGLGGTGVKAILDAKKMFYENYGEIPPMIGFIGIDTDRPYLSSVSIEANDGTKISLNASEQLCISVDDPLLIYNNKKGTRLFDWLPGCNSNGLSALSIGAGQMRSNGRFAVTVNENKIEQFINHKMTEVNNASIIDNNDYDLLSAETEVHMVFSLGGGTGSGTFLNIAYLLKRIFPKIKLSGYAVLSDVFRTMVPGAMSARVKTNGKGAIMDLDYLVHLSPDSESFRLKWMNNSDEITSRAFDALYFIDNRNENNDMFDNVDPICEMIALAIVTSVGELGVALDSVSDNVSKLIADGAMDIKNKKAWVASFGCAEIIFDGKKLAKVYEQKAAIQLINKMLNGGCDDPSIIANNWLDENKIRENLGKDDVIDYFMAPMPQYVLTDIDSLDNPLPECQNYLVNRAMEPQTRLDEKLSALEERIDESLSRLMKTQADRECGVYLCQQILNSLMHQIELCDGEMKEEKEQLEENKPRLEAALNTACNELTACMNSLFKKGKKDYESEVVNAALKIAQTNREIARRTMARRFYSWLKERINKSIDKIDVIMSNLQSIRNQCNTEIQRIQRSDANANFFQFDLSRDYAEKVECPMSDIVFNDFSQAMQSDGGVVALAGMTSKHTSEMIFRFIHTLDKVKAYKNMTVDNALEFMSEKELKTLLSNAVKKSLPLLPYSLRGYDADLRERPVESYYIGLPRKNTSPLLNNNLFQSLVPNAKDVQFSEVGFNDRVIIYRQLGVLPAFTIKALDNYLVEYEKWEESKPYGSHWDATLCERMKRERYKLEPKGVQPDLFETWINAIVYNLISFNKDQEQYQIRSRGMGGRPLQNWLVNMGSTRDAAFRYFEDNADVLVPEIKQAIRELDRPGPENPIKELSDKALKACRDNTYLQEVSKCPISFEHIQHYPAEMELIEKEIEYILDNIDR